MIVPRITVRSRRRLPIAATLLLLLAGACTERVLAPLSASGASRVVIPPCTDDPPTCDPPDPGPSPAPGERYGINVGGLIAPETPYSEETVRHVLGLAKAAGVRYVREDIYWNTAQPDGPYFNSAWVTEAEKYVRIATELDLQVVFVLSNTPGWARGNDNDSTHEKDSRYQLNGTNDPRFPAYPQMWQWYREYVAGLVTLYGDRVKYWSIWNEPNATDPVKGFLLLPGPDANGNRDYPTWQDAYSQMWIWAYDPINAHPGLVMVGPELANTPNSTDEMREFIARNGYRVRPQDIISFHWYGYETDGADNTLGGRARAFNSALAGMGRSNQIWVTEEGWNGEENKHEADDAFQAQSVTLAYRTFDAANVPRWTALFRYHLWAPTYDDWEQKWLVERVLQGERIRPAYYCLQALALGSLLPSGCQ
jgi:hypothetical protein